MNEEEIMNKLREMEADPNLITKPAYRSNIELWPDNKIPFVESHLDYLKNHKTLDPQHYLSNLRLMLRRNDRINHR